MTHKIACLILGYSAAPVLARSAPLMSAAGFDIFLHVDRKMELARYLASLGDAASHCLPIEDRVEVFWGGFSMVRAELNLLKAARNSYDYDKFILISDDSFPVFPQEFLWKRFETVEDQITIRKQSKESPFHVRYQDFFCYDHPATTVRTNPAKSPVLPIRSIDPTTLEHIASDLSFMSRVGKKKISVFHGPQFWALTRKTVDLVLHIHESDIHLAKSFEYSALPDESYIHSILGNFGGLDYAESAPVYSDFSSGGPRVVSSTDTLPLDLNAPHAFIRKFDPAATEFLDAVTSLLGCGLTIYGSPPAEALSTTSRVLVNGNEVCKVRLCAPTQEAEGWHGIETSWGRKFRWTATSRLRWEIDIPHVDTRIFRFFLATAISPASDWPPKCTLSMAGVCKPVQALGGELFADFSITSTERRVVVELATPEPRSPPPQYPDQRRLGLAVSL